MNNTVQNRVKAFVKKKGITNTEFCKAIGVSSNFINAIRKSISDKTLDSIIAVYPELNITWLLTGIGSMLNPRSGTLPTDNIFYLPYISVTEYGNYIVKHDDMSYIQSLPQLVVKHMPLNPDTVKFAFEVADDSMLNENNRYSFAAGNVVFADNIARDYSRIEKGKTYVVVLKNEIRICFCELINEDEILLFSRSKALAPDRTINKKDVLQIFFVIGGSF